MRSPVAFYDFQHWRFGRYWVYWCFHRECLFQRPGIMRQPGYWLFHCGPFEVSNYPIL